MNFPNLQLTAAGINAVLNAVYSGSTITFSKAKVGSGSTSLDPMAMTNLVHLEKEMGISSYSITPATAETSGFATLAFSFNNASLDNGFYLREMGIFAQVDNSTEFLYAYANAGSDAAYVKKYSDDDSVTMNFSETIAIGNAEHVTAIISGAVGFVTQEEYDRHVNNFNNPHQLTKSQVGLGNVVNVAPSNMQITFSQAASLAIPTSGSKLSVLMGLLSKAIKDLIAHLRDATNPHNTSFTQSLTAEGISSVPISKGGTGVTTKAALKALVKREIAHTTATLRAASWRNGRYDLGYSGYDVAIQLAPTATISQARQYAEAYIMGSASSNTLTALGAIPTVDIPVIITTMEVL